MFVDLIVQFFVFGVMIAVTAVFGLSWLNRHMAEENDTKFEEFELRHRERHIREQRKGKVIPIDAIDELDTPEEFTPHEDLSYDDVTKEETPLAVNS